MRYALVVGMMVVLTGYLHEYEGKPATEGVNKDQEQRAADEKKREIVLNNILTAYHNCVRTSARAQLTVDKNLAVERAFVACQTEETQIRLWGQLSYASSGLVEALIIKQRITLKNELIAER
jgi:hypothetical protein